MLGAFHHDSSPDQPPSQPLVEPLSKRELEILSLLAQRLPTKEIAAKLLIAPNTVKKTPEQYLSET